MSMSGVGGGALLWGMVAMVLGGLLLAPMQARGQDVAPEVRRRALEAFHGPDLEGKDGPLAKVGLDLALLYYEWEAYRERGAEGDFTPSQSSMPVRDGGVTVDATAARDPAALQRELEALGMERAARAGRIVSGQLPIAAIPKAARLASLQAMYPARAMTHRAPPAVPDTLGERPAEQPEREEADRTLWYVVGGVAVAAVAVAIFLLRR
mgnify:CR=1 FL=1